MALNDKKITVYANPVANLPDNPTQAGLTAAQLKAAFDANATGEIKAAINGIIDELLGENGSDIGTPSLSGISGTTVKEQLASIVSAMASLVVGTILDNSLTNAKLSSDIKVGSLANLTTTEKSNVVGAINEHDIKVGSLANLTTTEKSNVVGAINEHEQRLDGLPIIINNLTTGGTTNGLSAEQGKLLGKRVFSQPLYYTDTIAAGSSYVDLANFDLSIYRNFVFQAGSIVITVVLDDVNDLLLGTQWGISGGSDVLVYVSPTILNTNVKLFDIDIRTSAYAKIYARIENNKLYFVALQSTNTSKWKAVAW